MNTQEFSTFRYIPVAMLLLAFAACGEREDDAGLPSESQGDATERLDGSRAALAVDFATIRSKRLSVAERTQRASRVLLDGAAESIVVEQLPEPEARESAAVGTPTRRAALRVAHVSQTDDLLLINGLVADDHSEGTDIGETAARRIFDDTVARLSREGLDDVIGLDLGKVAVSRLRQASGQAGRPDTLRTNIKAYVFSAPRTVNGLEVLNSSLTIGVHRSGKLAAIHSRGVLPGSAPADPALAGPRARAQSAAEIQKRAQAEFPDANIQSLGLVYAVDAQADAKLASAVEPSEVFLVFPRRPDGSGFSRGRAVAYSVTDARAPVTYLDTQLQNDPGDARP